MKAIVFLDGRIEQREVGLGPLPLQWVRIQIAKAGLCGSDIAKLSSRNLPASHTKILGHEFIGQIVEFNGRADHVTQGDWVVGMPVLACGRCHACTHQRENLCVEAQAVGRTINGAFAEYVNTPVANVVRIPTPRMPDPYILVDPLAVCLHASKLDRRPFPNQTCLVVGDGTIGCLLAWLLHQQGCNTWIKGVHLENLRFIEGFGVNVLTTEVPTDRFDAIYETVGRAQSNTLSECLRAAKGGGNVVVLGVFTPGYVYPLIARELFIKEVRLQGSNAYVPAEFEEAVRLIGDNAEALASFISHRFPLFRFEEALITAQKKEEFTMKIVLEPEGLLS